MLPLLISMAGSPYARAIEIQEPDSNMSTEQSRVYQALVDTVSGTEEDDWSIQYSDNVPYLSDNISYAHPISLNSGQSIDDGYSDDTGVVPSEFACFASIQKESPDESTPVWAFIYLEHNENAEAVLHESFASSMEVDISPQILIVDLAEAELCGTTAIRWDLEIIKYYKNNGEVEEKQIHLATYVMFVYKDWYGFVGSNNFTPDADEISVILCNNLSSIIDKNSPPKAYFEISPPRPLAGEPVMFASTSTDAENDPMTFKWYIDDQYVSNQPSYRVKTLELGEHEITLKVTDSLGKTGEISRTVEVSESLYSFTMHDEQAILYDFSSTYPIVTLELKGTNWQEHRAKIRGVTVTFDLQLTGTNNLGSFQWPENEPALCRIPLQYMVQYLDGGLSSGSDPSTIKLEIPLYYILRNSNWLDLYEDPRFYLSHKHLVPDSRDWQSARAEATGIPEQLNLKLVMNPVELLIPSEQIGEPSMVIDLSRNPASEANFVLGKKIDLAKDSKLKIGNAPEQPWTSYSDIIVCVLYLTPIGTGTTIGLDIINGFIHLFKGESSSALLTWITAPASAAINIVLAAPSVAIVIDKFSIPSLVLERADETLRKLGYTSLKEIPPVASWPLWVNLNEEKLALMDQGGILHQVYWPSNLRIPLPYFTIESYIEVENYDNTALLPPPFQYTQLDAYHEPLKWIEITTSENIRIIPYPARFRPLRVVMDDPGEPEVLGTQKGLRIWTDGGGVMLLDWGTIDFGYADSPPPRLGPYSIHPGMESQPQEPDLKVYREQYIAIWEGNLKVVDEDREIGIYAGDPSAGLLYKPAAWCRGRGTEYDIEVIGGKSFQINVIEGQVDVTNRNMITIETMNAGSSKEYNLDDFISNEHPVADFVIAPENPSSDDIVLVTSLSTDPDGDPITYSWYIDNKYYAQASTSEGIVIEGLKPGKHSIKLIVEDELGGYDEHSAEITIGNKDVNSWMLVWIGGGVILLLLALGRLRSKGNKKV